MGLSYSYAPSVHNVRNDAEKQKNIINVTFYSFKK